MKKSMLLIVAFFAITIFCSQFASAQWVVCNNTVWRSATPYVTAPYFSVDIQAAVHDYDGWGEAGVYWTNHQGVHKSFWIYCNYPGCGKFNNIGTRNGGGIYVDIYCYTEGPAYGKAELWQW